jgi:hypothetical protein
MIIRWNPSVESAALSFVLIHIDAAIRAAIDRSERVGVARLINSCDIESVDYLSLARRSADDASKACHIRMNYRDGDY